MLRATSLPARAFRVLHHSFPVLLSGLALSIVAPGCGSDETDGDSDAGDNGTNGGNGNGSNGSSGGNSGGTGNTNNNGSNTGGTPDPEAIVGRFSIRLVPPSTAGGTDVPGFTSIAGKVYDGPVPEAVEWNKVADEGGCVLLKPNVPFCDPSCSGGDVCVAGNKCLPNPTSKDVGDVKLRGLTSEVTLKNVANAYSVPAGVNLPYPAFAEGAGLTLDASGGAFSPFTILAKGIAPLVISADSYALEANTPLSLTWQAAAMAGISKVQIKLDISHHGGTKGKIECEVDDTGSLSIPASMIATLTSLGVAGFPTISISRSNKSTASIAPGKVELYVYSDIELPIKVPGVTSCTSNEECPSGQTCQSDLTCK